MSELGKDSIEFKFFQKFWAFFKAYNDHDDSDETWRQIMAEARVISDEFKELNEGYEFANNIMFTTLRYLEQKGKTHGTNEARKGKN